MFTDSVFFFEESEKWFQIFFFKEALMYMERNRCSCLCYPNPVFCIEGFMEKVLKSFKMMSVYNHWK